jgi:hypothetical protein
VPLLNGMDRPKGWNGIERTGKELGRFVSLFKNPARFVGALTVRIGRTRPNTVQVHVHRGLGIGAISRKLACALGAVRSSWRTATAKLNVVPVSVETASVSPTSVYNLTLVHDNAYYANGILVYNCLTFSQPIGSAGQRRSRGKHVFEYDPFVIHQAANTRQPEYNPFGGWS